MKCKNEFIKDLEKNVNDLEKHIKYNKFYNTKNFLLKKMIKTGVSATFLLPAILTSILSFNIMKKINLTPFLVDKVSSHAKIITTDTTTGKHKEVVTYEDDFSYSPTFEYSTAWKLNENNFFERNVVKYRLDDKVKEIDFNELLKMSDNEIKKFFVITNKERIQKAYLDEEDYFYTDDMFIITDMHEDQNKTKMVNESDDKNILNTSAYIVLLIILIVVNNSCLKQLKIYKKMNTNLDNKYKIIRLENLDELKKILKIRKENLQLMEEPEQKIYIKKR